MTFSEQSGDAGVAGAFASGAVKTLYGGNRLPDLRDLPRVSARVKRRGRDDVMYTIGQYDWVDEPEEQYLDDYDEGKWENDDDVDVYLADDAEEQQGEHLADLHGCTTPHARTTQRSRVLPRRQRHGSRQRRLADDRTYISGKGTARPRGPVLHPDGSPAFLVELGCGISVSSVTQPVMGMETWSGSLCCAFWRG